MRLIARLLLAAVALLAAAGRARRHRRPTGSALARGINITNWFRYPARADEAGLRFYLDDAAIAELRRAGFTFVRLPVQPELLDAVPARLGVLLQAIARLQRAGLAVVVEPHPASWHLEQSEADRGRLLGFWHRVAPTLRSLEPRLTYPEILNEPVFQEAPANGGIAGRGSGGDPRRLAAGDGGVDRRRWGSVDGLAALHPVVDPNVIYSFHFYEPAELPRSLPIVPGWIARR